ncbi:MAG: DegT/DnrJ/EryC1/StrS family aminotransferase, partial [Syntrophomonas sp.]
IGPGDEVITTPFTFIATLNAIMYVGATPVLADIDPRTFNLDPVKVKSLIGRHTRAIIPVHLFGLPADMESFSELASIHGLVLIEDACQAHGAQWNKQMVGSFGTGCFSFYPTKNMTSGEGGMITTDDNNLAEHLRLLRNHGMKTKYDYVELGFNFRMSDIHAAIGLSQLSKLETFIKTRQKNAAFLSERLQDLVECPFIPPAARHVFNQYTIKVNTNRDQLLKNLLASEVGAAVYYPMPLHHHRFWNKNDLQYPVAEAACQSVLSLPVHPRLGQSDLEHITRQVREIIALF